MSLIRYSLIHMQEVIGPSSAPIDDESETKEEGAAVAEGRDAWRTGEVVSDEELRRDLSL